MTLLEPNRMTMSTDDKAAKPITADPSGSEDRKAASAYSWVSTLLTRLGLQNAPTLRDTLEDALKSGGDEQNFSAEEREMLIRLLRFGASRVDDIMVPRADIIAIDESEPIGEVVRLFEEAGISRIPVYHETLDDPRGMVHIKDLFRWISAEAAGRPLIEPRLKGEERAKAVRKAADEDVAENGERIHDLTKIDLKRPISSTKIRRPVLYVPPSMPAMSLLIRMQTSRVHMALVVDEYGGTDGLVTIEDLVEQIVGDIEDEHDEAEAEHIIEDAKLGTIASGRTPVSELEELVGTKLLTEDEEEDIDTLGGLVFQIVGRVPTRGEIIRHSSGLEFEILEADPRRVKRLKILRPKMGTPVPSASGATGAT
jgi:CBS domain containing-hemolysin-like protein